MPNQKTLIYTLSCGEVRDILDKYETDNKTVCAFKKYLESVPKNRVSIERLRQLKLDQELVSDIRQITMYANTGLGIAMDRRDAGKF